MRKGKLGAEGSRRVGKGTYLELSQYVRIRESVEKVIRVSLSPASPL